MLQFSDTGEGPYGYSQLQGYGSEQVRQGLLMFLL